MALAEALAESCDEAIVLIDGQGPPFFARNGDPVTSIVQRAPLEVFAQPDEVLHDADIIRIQEVYERLIKTPGRREATTFWIRHPDGHMIQLRAMGVNKLEEDLGAVLIRISVVASKHDVPAFGGDTEPPTPEPPTPDPDGVPGSWRGHDMLSREDFLHVVQRAVHLKERKIWAAPAFAKAIARDRRFDFSVVLLDLDRHKIMRGGFAQGEIDETIRQVGVRLKETLRGRDAIGHLGGNEVGVLIDGVGESPQAMDIVDGLLSLLSEPISVGAESVTLNPAVGIATSERRYKSADEVIRDATAAVNRSLKSKGKRRRMAFETGMRVEDRRKIALMADLHKALLRKELWIAYQPVVSLRDGTLSGFEALARWDHPMLGLVSPTEFIPLAEERGLIKQLGSWVLEHVCSVMAGWTKESQQPALTISVNVSPAQLADDDFADDVEAILARTALDPSQLRLEITESTVLSDLESTTALVKRLKDHGVSFALDDFGTGYSSLSFLHELPYDHLKIDRAFVAGMGTQNEKVLTAIVRLAHALSMEVVAEGVETERQKGALERMSCDYAQGFLLAKPLDEEAAAAMLHSRPRWC